MPDAGRVAARLGLTDGQVSTLALGVAIGVASLVIGLPPVLRQTDQIISAEPSVPPARVALEAAQSEVVDAFVAISDALVPVAPVTATPATPPTGISSSAPATIAPAKTQPESFIRTLAIAESGWARSRGITDVFPPAIDSGDLPVGATLGREDYRSFVRLRGDGLELRLAIVDDHPDNRGAETATIQACPNTTDAWVAGGDQAISDAPEFDLSHCVEGIRDGSSFRFDLTGLAVEPDAGLSLLAGLSQTAPSFAVVLRPLEESAR